jgi:alpha-glucosidase
MQYVDQDEIDPLILHVYPKQGLNLDSLYEDDGISFDYEKSVYSITTFELTIDQDKISFITNRQPGNYLIAKRNFLTKIHSVKLIPRNVEVNGEKLKKVTSKNQLSKSDFGWYYESESKLLDLKYPDTGKLMKVEVNF